VSIISCTFSFKRILLLSVCICGSFLSNAQLCTGSLGDPAVNITFGSGGNTNLGFAPPSAYTYINSPCPNDGYYTVTTFTSACFGNAWHTVNADHTGNGGAFMLVNASYTPGDFFVTTLTGLCPNTTYEFAAWLMNVLISPTGIKPNITFSIETPSGTILNQFNTGGINATSQPQWQQYGFFFTTTVGNPDIVLRMTNNAPGGIGNDIALDDITFRPCGPVVSSAIQGNSNNKVDVCLNDQVNYTFTGNASPGFMSPVFQWQVSNDSGAIWRDIPGTNSLTYQRQATVAGNYWYRLTVAENGTAGITNCRIGSNLLNINVHAKPAINAGPDRVIIAGGSTILAATVNDSNLIFSWSPPDYLNSTSTLNPLASPPAGLINYLLSVVSEYGCTNEDNVVVKVVAGIFVPTAFTPNNDGKNDTWQIPFLDPQMGATVSVYNRWGQLIYLAAGTTVDWNGKFNGLPQPTGTYVYMIHFIDGRKDMKGTVSIIR
jgi:gliding motility-associated-like protein